MVAAMSPVLMDGEVVFCTLAHAAAAEGALAIALASFREAEGVSLLLRHEDAVRLGFSADMPMRQITLRVFSALDGVGLTAAVASALAERAIPCNMIAAFHHDHVFVPSALAHRALRVLQDLQGRENP
jgi:hypothetical protein